MDGNALTQDECLLVGLTFEQLAPVRTLFGELLYQQWFELAPDIELLLGDAGALHRAMLIEALVNGVPSVIDAQPRDEALRVLGRWHDRHAFERIHYRALQEALLWTLRQTLGEVASAETLRAWCVYCASLCERMLAAGAEERLALTIAVDAGRI